VSARTGVQIAPFMIGPGRDVLDLYDDWAALSEVSERGCVLVRPDLHVAWRSHDLVADPTAELGRVVEAILGSAPSSTDTEPSATSHRPLTTA
jgi:2,4-dichlorophenol 6-monooxygenase